MAHELSGEGKSPKPVYITGAAVPLDVDVLSQPPALDWVQAVSFGMVPGWSVFLMQGTNPDVDVGTTPEDLSPGGGPYVFPTTDVSCHIISNDLNDTAAGTGGRTVRIFGLNSALVPIQEDVVLNGTLSVALVNNYYRVNGMTLLTAGASEMNTGTIFVRVNVGLDVLCAIPPNFGRGQTGVYTVPAGKRAWMMDGFFCQFNIAGNSYCGYHVMTRPPGGAWQSRAFVSTGDGTTSIGLQPRAFSPLVAGSDIKIRAIQVGTNNTQVTANITMVLQDV